MRKFFYIKQAKDTVENSELRLVVYRGQEMKVWSCSLTFLS